MSKDRGWKPPPEWTGVSYSARFLDAKGEEAKTPGDVVALRWEKRDLTADEMCESQARINAGLETCQQGYEEARNKADNGEGLAKKRAQEEQVYYISGALNFCPKDQALPIWLRKAVDDNFSSQLLLMGQDGAFLLHDQHLMQTFAAEYKAAKAEAKKRRRAPTPQKPEARRAAYFGLSVEGLRKKRQRAKKALGMVKPGQRGRPKKI